MTAGRIYNTIHFDGTHAEAICSDRSLGNVDVRFGDPEEAIANQDMLIRALNPVHFILQKVLLKPDFEDLSDVPTEELRNTYRTDGIFINRPRIALGLNTADCNAIAMYDGKAGSVLGLIHAGRQGVTKDIHLAALENLTAKHGVAKEDIRMFFAPAIQKESYFYPQLTAEILADRKWYQHIELHKGNCHIDLLGRVVQEFTDTGIQPDQMHITDIDVGADERFFSNTRYNHALETENPEPQGRNGVAVVLR